MHMTTSPRRPGSRVRLDPAHVHAAIVPLVASLLTVTTTTAQVYGPSALGGSLRRFTELMVTLARTDFRLRNLGSALVPRMAIPLSVSLTSVFSVSMNFIAVLLFALSGITPAPSRLEMFATAAGFDGLPDVRQA
jgi:hypothetical protein